MIFSMRRCFSGWIRLQAAILWQLALFNYKSAGKPLKEIVRLLLNAVDYLDNGEIARIYNKLTEMEHQNPLEQMRLAADQL